MKKRTINRRDFLRMSAAVTAGAFLTGCASSATPAPDQPAAAATEQPTEAAAQAAEAVTISWWNQYQTDTVKEAVARIIPDFQTKYPNIKVEYEISGGPPGGGDLAEVLLSRIAGGNPPDTVTLFGPPSQYGALGSLEAIDDLMATATLAKPNAFYENVLKTCQWQGKTYGLPASAGALAIYINKNKFEEKGISTKREDFPKTWDEWKKLSAELVVWEGDELKQAGFVPPWLATWQYPMWSALNGSQLFDAENAKYTLNTEQNIEWLEFWLQWMEEQYRGDVDAVNLMGNWDGVYEDSAFVIHQLSAMTSEGSWGATDVEWPFEWEIVKYPYGPSASKSVTGFWPNWFAIPKGSAHKEAAFLFIEYFATEGWATWYEFIADTPSWKGFPQGVITKKLIDLLGQERAQDFHNFFAEYLNDAAPMWNSPIDAFAADTLQTALGEVSHKSKTPQEALNEAQQLCQSKLEETLKSVK